MNKFADYFFSEAKISDSSIDELVVKVRQLFLKHYELNPQDYDESDIERVTNNEFTVKRFIIWNKLDPDAALKQLDECMKWRKSFGINLRG